jgi:hypothetical protein
MPKALPIHPDLLHIIFDYDAETGQLIPKPTAERAARRKDKLQWEIGASRYSLNRLVWAWHNPYDPNPYAIQHRDGDRYNTRIENLYPIPTHPRWVNHVKQIPAKLDSHTGAITLLGELPRTQSPTTPPHQPRMGLTPTAPKPPARAPLDTGFDIGIDNLERMLPDNRRAKPAEPYDPFDDQFDYQ